MKNTITAAIVVALVIIGFTAINSSARGWGNGGNCPGYGMNYGGGNANVDNQKFFEETKDIRIQIATDRAELNALMIGGNPDEKRVRELSESIATQQIALQEKARSYGWGNDSPNGSFRRGPGMRGGGYGSCCN